MSQHTSGRTTIAKHHSILAAGLCLTAPLAAQSPHQNLYPRLQVGASVTSVILNSNIRIDPASGEGTEVDAENDLGLPTTQLEPRLMLRWRPGHRHEIEVSYQFVRRSSTKTINRDIIFGDSTYHAGATVETKLNTDQAVLVYRLAFMAKPRTQVGLALGAGAIFLNVGLNALASGGGVQFAQSDVKTGPLGSLGLYGRFLSGDRWMWEADARYVRLTVDRFTAHETDGGAALRYAPSPRWAIEGGYGLTAVKVDIAAVRGSGLGSRSGLIKYSQQHVRLGMVFTP